MLLFVWNLRSGRKRHFSGHQSSIASAAAARESPLLATASRDKTARVWDMTSGAGRVTLKGMKDEATAIDFLDHDTLLAVGGKDGSVWIWKLTAT